MLEELIIAFAKIVQARLIVPISLEAVLRTFPMTGKLVFAFLALARQHLVLHLRKLFLLVGIHHFRYGLRMDIPQLVFWIDEMVARIEISIKLHDAGMATLLCHGAEPRGHPNPVCQRGIKQLHEIFAHIMMHPFIKDRT